jgi:hypothetical protein
MEAPTAHKLTNGDLDGMDAGQLREHLLAYRLKSRILFPLDHEYTEALVARIAALLEIDADDEDALMKLDDELDVDFYNAKDQGLVAEAAAEYVAGRRP